MTRSSYDFEKELLDDLHAAQRLQLPAATRRPVARRTVVPLTGVGLLTAGGVAATIVALGAGTTPFAGWTPVANAASTAATSTAGAACQPRLVSRPSGAPQPDWQIVASEARGPFTLVVYSSGDDHATCLSGPSTTLTSEIFGAGGRATEIVGSAAATHGHGAGSSMLAVTNLDDRVVTVLQPTSADGTYTIVQGRVDSDVTGVSLTRADGTTVDTTVSNGWFLAWWPGAVDPTSAAVTTANGTTTQSLPAPKPPSALNSAQQLQGSPASLGNSGPQGNSGAGNSGVQGNSSLGSTGPQG